MEINKIYENGAKVRVLGAHEWIHTKDGSRRKAPRPSFLFILSHGKENRAETE